MLLLLMSLFSGNFLNAQSCSPLYFEVCRILPDLNSYPENHNNPGPFHGFYRVKLKSTAGILPPAWNVNYLAFSGKVTVNGFTSRINVDLTNQFSQTISGGTNPYFQYLSVTEHGEVDWAVGSVSNCNQGEPGVILPIPNGAVEIELFTIVVDGVPGDIVNFSGDNPNIDWVGDIKDCNYYYCSGTIPVRGCTNPANFLILFPTPLTCNPERNVTFDLMTGQGIRSISVTLNNLIPLENVKMTDMVVHIMPQMNGINNLDLEGFQAIGGPPIVKKSRQINHDGSIGIYFKAGAFLPTSNSTQVFIIVVSGEFNFSQGASLVCNMSPGRTVISLNGGPNTICSLTSTANTLIIPGYSACSDMLNIAPTRYIGADCTLGVKYTIRHNSPTPIDYSYFKLRFVFFIRSTNSPGTPTSNLPCQSCSSIVYNAMADAWEYTYEQTTPLSLPNISEVIVPFNVNIDCIEHYILMAEATPTGNSTCAMGVNWDWSQWPACNPSVQGSIVVDKGGAPALAPLYKVTLESTSDTSYSMFNDEDCKADYSFCPNPVKAPFQIRLESSSPNNYLCGVTTYDLVLISKHIMNIAPFTVPKAWIAADASLATPGQQNSVSPNDIASIRRCILGIDTAFGITSAPSWWYFRDGYTFNTPIPLDPPYVGANISAVPANGLGSYGNFFAVKVGDINHTCDCGMKPGGSEHARPFLKASTSNFKHESNIVCVPVWSDAPFNLIAAQAGFRFDPSLLSLKAVIPNPELEISDLNFGVNNAAEGEFRFAWSPFDGQTPLPKKVLLFTLQFELKDKLDLPPAPLFWTSEDILQNLVYQEDGSEFQIQLNWEERGQERPPSLVLVVSPNPFEERMTAFVYVEKPVKATIRLSDGKGFIYSQQTVELQSGDNAVEVQSSASTQPGVYFLSIEADGQKIQRSVVKI